MNLIHLNIHLGGDVLGQIKLFLGARAFVRRHPRRRIKLIKRKAQCGFAIPVHRPEPCEATLAFAFSQFNRHVTGGKSAGGSVNLRGDAERLRVRRWGDDFPATKATDGVHKTREVTPRRIDLALKGITIGHILQTAVSR